MSILSDSTNTGGVTQNNRSPTTGEGQQMPHPFNTHETNGAEGIASGNNQE